MIPRIKPVQFEEFPAFRETFLVRFTMPGDAEAFRTIGRLTNVMACAPIRRPLPRPMARPRR